MNLGKLIPQLDPAGNPLETGPAQKWSRAENSLKLKFPRDYCEFFSTFGSGEITREPNGDVIYFYNPFAAEFSKFIKRELKMLRDYRKDEGPEEFPYDVYPRSGGLLLIGRSSNGADIYYLTVGKPDAWPVLVRSDDEFERYDMTLTAFLSQLLSGKPTPPWPAKWLGRGKSVRFVSKLLESLDTAEVDYKSIYELYRDAGQQAPFWFRSATDDETRASVVISIDGKTNGKIEGAPQVVIDIFENGKILLRGREMGERAGNPIFALIPRPF